ncbi:MAG TPA: LysM peptidoglycan-binding domain-containing protein [Anaerohalosphaeraceae bacterium]|mgnify:CR=1 FL=1|nr:LysM peptidoglycan-binding domain-containing protein [Anaerohalosphaeraceae bacterium]HOL31809.1 LysM peptidoglycan-binding domain-containing protein [Anaerohalosphaeraceae bacterium]HOM75477.1 LysM peptidoglycan-binding domain-containing protein [Anaerohalosphaeraceae bacterium]HPC63795.1 LysM peptidoglycan-binding domain-containing protein [Anaerohalosphaeraceae bacterium]HPO70099.1 LysM peptidoglycan-binding domain-containing protein [Anaerohalosphaeraceae bacterium]
MTADAKIGLLLGLFFIVIIAFLVNGLPNFVRQNDSKPLDAAITASGSSELIIDNSLTEAIHRLRPQIELRQTEPSNEVLVIDSSAQPIPQQSLETVSQPQMKVQTEVAAAVTPVPAPKQESGIQAVQPASRSVQPVSQKFKTHIVQSGEHLSSIAQKYYGKEDGNRRLVIQKLYETNAKTLKSPDHIQAGDKLVIPPLDELLGAPQPSVSQPSETLLSKFSSLLERAGKEDTKKVSEYVVRQGDSLWSISEKTLGDGKRYNEIIQLNKDRIKNADDVAAGMTLKIPAR